MPPFTAPLSHPYPSPEDAKKLLSIVPKSQSKPYDPMDYLSILLDPDSIFEIGPLWGRPHRTMLARVDGMPVVVLASDPRYEGGAITADAAMKVSRIIGIACTFHLVGLLPLSCEKEDDVDDRHGQHPHLSPTDPHTHPNSRSSISLTAQGLR